MANGEQVEVNLDRDENPCMWDIRVNYEDGDTGEWSATKLCETSTVTLD